MSPCLAVPLIPDSRLQWSLCCSTDTATRQTAGLHVTPDDTSSSWWLLHPTAPLCRLPTEVPPAVEGEGGHAEVHPWQQLQSTYALMGSAESTTFKRQAAAVLGGSGPAVAPSGPQLTHTPSGPGQDEVSVLDESEHVSRAAWGACLPGTG